MSANLDAVQLAVQVHRYVCTILGQNTNQSGYHESIQADSSAQCAAGQPNY